MSEIKFKACVTCKSEQLATTDFFNKKTSSSDGLQNVCKTCNALHGKKHYEANKDKIKKRTRDREQRLRPILQQFVLSFLIKGCVDCGEKDIIVLDFDHLGDKKNSISRMMHDCVSLDLMEEEISKCEVRCANCHRRKTAKDFNWWRLLSANNVI